MTRFRLRSRQNKKLRHINDLSRLIEEGVISMRRLSSAWEALKAGGGGLKSLFSKSATKPASTVPSTGMSLADEAAAFSAKRTGTASKTVTGAVDDTAEEMAKLRKEIDELRKQKVLSPEEQAKLNHKVGYWRDLKRKTVVGGGTMAAIGGTGYGAVSYGTDWADKKINETLNKIGLGSDPDGKDNGLFGDAGGTLKLGLTSLIGSMFMSKGPMKTITSFIAKATLLYAGFKLLKGAFNAVANDTVAPSNTPDTPTSTAFSDSAQQTTGVKADIPASIGNPQGNSRLDAVITNALTPAEPA